MFLAEVRTELAWSTANGELKTAVTGILLTASFAVFAALLGTNGPRCKLDITNTEYLGMI